MGHGRLDVGRNDPTRIGCHHSRGSASGHQLDRYRAGVRLRAYPKRSSAPLLWQATQAVIATKVGLEWRDGPDLRKRETGARIMQEIDDSLRRLRTDYIDIYQVHWPDPWFRWRKPAEPCARSTSREQIRAIGCSNSSVEQMERFRRVAPLTWLQPPYIFSERAIEAEILPYCRANNI